MRKNTHIYKYELSYTRYASKFKGKRAIGNTNNKYTSQILQINEA